MSNTDRDSMLERWADGMEKLEQYYEGKYGPPATPPSLPPITTRDAMLEAIADGMERAKRNINKKSPTYHSDSVAYVKTVPSGDVHYASLEQIGGKTLVWNQLIKPANIGASKTQNGITFTNNGDGSVTVSGTATGGNAGLSILSPRTWADHKFCLRGCPAGGSSSTYCLRLLGQGNNYFDTGDGVIWYHATARYKQCDIVVYEGTVISTPITFRPTFVDLTLLYGAGNEPSTVAEFTAQFPASYYPYNAGTLLSAGVTEVKSVGRNLCDVNDHQNISSQTVLGSVDLSSGTYTMSATVTNNTSISGYLSLRLGSVAKVTITIANGDSNVRKTATVTLTESATYTVVGSGASAGYSFDVAKIQIEKGTTATEYVPYANPLATYSIPAEIQALEGYGWSAGSVYNYIDYERKVFVKCVDRVVLDGTQTSITNVNWRANENGVGWIYPYSVAPCKIPLTANIKANLICAELPTNTYNNLYGQQVGVGVYVDNSRSIVIWQSNTSLTTSSAINTYLTANPITVYYELATPVEVDISAYITDDNLISVEAGGSLTFPNSNGTDYQIPVPSSETFVVGEL